MTNHDQTNSSAGGEETIRKVYVQDLKDRERIHTVFRVTQKAKVTARSGKSFLTLTFTDRTGHVDGRVFENPEQVEQGFLEGDYVLVKGGITMFRNKPQVVAETIERLEPGPIDAAEFTPPPEAPAPVAEAPAAAPSESEAAATPRQERTSRASGLRSQIEALPEGPIRAVLLALVDDHRIEEGLRRGGKSGRPALAAQIEGQLELVQRAASSYPRANPDLLVAGVVLAGVARALEVGDEARLVGGAVLAAQKLHEKVRHAEVPFALAHQLTHLVLAVEDPRTQSAARPAMTIEAELVRTLVSLDLRLAQWEEALLRDGAEHWTRPLEDGRTLFRSGPAAPRRPRKERKPREARPERSEAATGATAPAQRERPQREPREAREARPQRPARELPSELSFKPFSALASLTGVNGSDQGGGNTESN